MQQIDPDYSIHATAGQLMALLAYRLADPLIPFDIETYARNINHFVRDFIGETFNYAGPKHRVMQKRIAISELDLAAKTFQDVAHRYADVTTSKEFLANATRV